MTVRPNKEETFLPALLQRFGVQALVVFALSFFLYGNTINNGAALDDTMVILRNKYVLEGIKGIPDILTRDTYDSYYQQNASDNPLSGGRYRPLSVITFAIEQQFLGAYSPGQADSVMKLAPSYYGRTPYEQVTVRNMHFRHFVNVLLFALSMVVLLYFLQTIVLPGNAAASFIATILFVIHPVHTEVVANVKSRDELLSLLFICLTFIYSFRYYADKSRGTLAGAIVCFLLALLSKEYAITLLILLPLSFYLFHGEDIKGSIRRIVPFSLVAVGYVVARYFFSASGTNVDVTIQNNAYAYATGVQHVATRIATSADYLRLLLFPYPLSSDYSYNSIPYKTFAHPMVWVSVLAHSGILVMLVVYMKRKNVKAFALAFYLLNLLLVNNWLFYIGATMGERLIYHSSVGFVIVVALLLSEMAQRSGRAAVYALLAMLTILLGFQVVERNKDWMNTNTLALRDVETMPNSIFLNGNVGIMYMNKANEDTLNGGVTTNLVKAITYFDKALAVSKDFVPALGYKSGCYFRLKEPDSVLACLDKLRLLQPNYPGLWEPYFNAGVLYYRSARYANALAAWKKALEADPGNIKVQNAINILYSAKLLPQ